MKTTLIVLLLLFQTVFLFAQCEYSSSYSASKDIKDAIANEFNKWLVKSEFETNADYEARIKSNSDEMLKKITDSVVQTTKEEHLKMVKGSTLGTYDPENETFPVIFLCQCYDRYDTFYIKVPKNLARSFSETFNGRYGNPYSHPQIYLVPLDVSIVNDRWKITRSLLLFDNFWDMILQSEQFKLFNEGEKYSCQVGVGSYKNPKKNLIDFKTATDFPQKEVYYYEWKISDQPNYKPSYSRPISFTLEDLNITLPIISINSSTENKPKAQVPDLDMNSIQAKNKNPNAFAVVIGNKDYQYTKKVSFAINDAQTIKSYLINVLGYSEGNIFYIENATKSNLETYFGTKENPQGKLFNNIKQGISDVFIYYAGHGAPGLKDKKGYFVPVDCDPNYIEQGGYSLNLFYNNLAKLNAKSISVVTDACFSGADVFDNISSIAITVPNPIAVADNCVVLSSSSGSQVSSWYNDKQHGMFTYFFLKALQDRDKSDKNKDGKLTFEEIYEYVSDKTEGVPYYSRSINGVEQNPTIEGEGAGNVFLEYK